MVVIGSGMMGSSIVQTSLNHKVAKNITVIVNKDQYVKTLSEQGINATKDYKVTANCDFVIISTNLASYDKVIQNLNQHVSKKAVVTDIGSVKEMPDDLFNTEYKYPDMFVPSHPIAGSDKSGFGVVVDGLFENKKAIITAKKKASVSVESFYKAINMDVEYLTSAHHDQIYAEISHLPQLLAFECKEATAGLAHDVAALNNEPLQKFLRLGNSNKDLWDEIFRHNMRKIVDLVCLYKENYRLNNDPQRFFTQLENYQKELKAFNQNLPEPSLKTDLMAIKQIIVSYLDAINLKNSKYAGSGFSDFIQPLFVE
jgi:prephenate dehydrogenase